MNFKHSKQAVISNIYTTVYNQYFDSSLFSDNQSDEIKRYLRDAVNAAFESFVNDIYTSSEFEKDLGLK